MADDGLGDLPADRIDRVEGHHRLLEDHADLGAAQVRKRAVAHRHHILPGELDAARKLRPAGREQPHQGAQGDALAGAGLAQNAEHLARIEGEGDAVHRVHGGVPSGEADRDILRAKDRRCRLRRHAQAGAWLWPEPATRIWQATR